MQASNNNRNNNTNNHSDDGNNVGGLGRDRDVVPEVVDSDAPTVLESDNECELANMTGPAVGIWTRRLNEEYYGGLRAKRKRVERARQRVKEAKHRLGELKNERGEIAKSGRRALGADWGLRLRAAQDGDDDLEDWTSGMKLLANELNGEFWAATRVAKRLRKMVYDGNAELAEVEEAFEHCVGRRFGLGKTALRRMGEEMATCGRAKYRMELAKSQSVLSGIVDAWQAAR